MFKQVDELSLLDNELAILRAGLLLFTVQQERSLVALDSISSPMMTPTITGCWHVSLLLEEESAIPPMEILGTGKTLLLS